MNEKLTFGRKLAFAVCDIFGGGSFNIVNFLYPGFLALTVGLSPYYISIIMLISRLWDAISDPLMGKLSDSTKSRFGKRRIYFLISAPLVLLSMFFMFFPYSFSSVTLRFAAVMGSYILFCTVQTMVMIPYFSFASEISSDYQKRASANSLRLGFSIFSSIICVAVPGIIVGMFEGGTGYIVMSIVFGTIFALSVLITGLFARAEIDSPPSKQKFSFREYFEFFRVKPFRQYLLMYICLQLSMAIMSSLFFFFIDFYICRDITAAGETNMLGTLSAGLMFAMQIVALPIYLKMIEKKGKAFTYRFGALLWIITALGLLFVPSGVPDFVVYIFAGIMGLSISAPGLAPHTMIGDVNDAIALVLGSRKEGMVAGMINLANKISQSIALALVMALLGLFGFVEKDPGAAALLSQPQSAQTALQIIISTAPLVFMGIGVIISFKYKIDRDKQHKIKELLDKNEAGDASAAEEISDMKKELL